MDQKVHILALQKKTYASPRENMDAVRDMLDQYKGEMPDFLLLPEIFTCPYDNSQLITVSSLCLPRRMETAYTASSQSWPGRIIFM